MDNFEKQSSDSSTTESHKKLFIGIFVAAIILLVTGGIIWYTVKSNDVVVVPIDTDRDLLSDEEERALGTDPAKEDTDADGLSDYEEVQIKSDPKNPHSLSDAKLDGEAFINQYLDREQKRRDAKSKQ
jgi:hypothetical protein